MKCVRSSVGPGCDLLWVHAPACSWVAAEGLLLWGCLLLGGFGCWGRWLKSASADCLGRDGQRLHPGDGSLLASRVLRSWSGWWASCMDVQKRKYWYALHLQLSVQWEMIYWWANSFKLYFCCCIKKLNSKSQLLNVYPGFEKKSLKCWSLNIFVCLPSRLLCFKRKNIDRFPYVTIILELQSL